MMKAVYVLTLCLGLACAARAGFFGPLELGMTQQQAEQALSSYDGVKPPGQTTAFGSETETQHFTTTRPFGAANCRMDMGFKDGEGLVSLTLESFEGFPAGQYDATFKSRYKQLAMMQQSRYGAPLSVRPWPKADSLKPGQIMYLHIYRMSPEMLAYTGIYMTRGGTFHVVARFAAASTVPDRFEPVKPEVLQAWSKVPEFFELKEADEWNLKALEALVEKKPKVALECFTKAADLGSARGYWGLSFMYAGGKGISSDRALSKEMRDKAASLGFAMSAVEVDRDFNAAMQKLKVPPSEVKIMIDRMQRAAAEGISSEQYNLGIMYKNGYGLPRNPAKARALFEAAAAKGDKQAASALASMK